jgi:hypothetical protein
MSIRKYEAGAKVKSFAHFAKLIEQQKPFYWRDKYLSPGFIQNWQVRIIYNSIKAGVLYEAKPITKRR